MATMVTVKPFHYWCYKILPLVYDDSLSYYEVLCKAVEKLNLVIENNNNLPNIVKEALAEGGYLDNLQEQIAAINDKDSATATADRDTGELVWLNGDLYRITRPMLAGDQYIESGTGITGNIEKLTFEQFVNRFREYVKEAITDSTEEYNVLASKAYKQGDLIWWYDKLYRASDNIVKNANLIIGTNLEEITLEDIIKAIQSRLDDDELYPIYYSSRLNMTFKGTIGQRETVEAKADTHSTS